MQVQIKKYFSTVAELGAIVKAFVHNPNTIGYRITIEEFNDRKERAQELDKLKAQRAKYQKNVAQDLQKVNERIQEMNQLPS